MSCILRIGGKDLDIDNFAGKVDIFWYKEAYKGTSRNLAGTKKYDNSSLSVTTSDAGFNEICRQIDDTVRFLNHYKNKLLAIKDTPEVEFATINFGVDSNIDEEHLTQSFNLPVELIAICGQLGIAIEISIYKQDMQLILEKKTHILR